jgi:hypothetical protein
MSSDWVAWRAGAGLGQGRADALDMRMRNFALPAGRPLKSPGDFRRLPGHWL